MEEHLSQATNAQVYDPRQSEEDRRNLRLEYRKLLLDTEGTL